MDHEKFKNVCAGLQSIALTIAIIAGGAWAVFEFVAFRKVERAETELQKLHGSAYLEVDVTATQLPPTSSKFKLVELEVLLENRGQRSILVRPGALHTWLYKIEHDSNGKVVESQTAFTPQGEMTHEEIGEKVHRIGAGGNWMIQPGEKKERSIIIAVPDAGLYRAHFTVLRNPKAKDVFIALMRDAGVTGEIGSFITWGSRAFVSVK